GTGNDKLYGGYKAALNIIAGNEGHDLLIGGDFAVNNMDGGTGNDYLRRGSGTPSSLHAFNTMIGGARDDVLQRGGYAINFMYAAEGNDVYMDIVGLGYGSYNYYSIDKIGSPIQVDLDIVSTSYHSEADCYLKWGF